jgi:tRNA (guanine26-N2/guanine27-N2)-dimethyltransferase
MYKIIREGSAEIYVPKEEKISKSLPVFYNKKMKLNRDIALYIINRLKPESILDAMAGTGIRAIRILKETSSNNITANDINPEAFKLIKKNAKLNNVNPKIKNKDVNILLQESKYDFIDIDPFGSPIFYMDSAIPSMKDNGTLAVTATDLGCLYGKHVKACQRKYNSTPVNYHGLKPVALPHQPLTTIIN